MVRTRAVVDAPILLAADGRGSASSAILLAQRLAERWQAPVVVVSVVEAPSAYRDDAPSVVDASIVTTGMQAERAAAVRRDLHAALGMEPDWPLEIGVGQTPRVLARRARELGARLLVLGLGRHSPVDRLFGHGTALRTLRMADRPLLAVQEGLDALPTRALLATDFSAASIAAAEQAMPLLEDGAVATLVHVATRRAGNWPGAGTWDGTAAAQADVLAARVQNWLAGERGIAVDSVRLEGDPVDALVRHAGTARADLIVLGSHGHGFLERLLVGSVATGVMHRARTSVLAVPPPPLGETLRRDDALVHSVQSRDTDEWIAMLAAFSHRNAGRPAAIEVDDPEFGAQSQAVGYALLGAAYDPHDGRVELMLGELGNIAHHLTRSIPGARSIAVLADEDERDRVLRVEHDGGQTLLRLARI